MKGLPKPMIRIALLRKFRLRSSFPESGNSSHYDRIEDRNATSEENILRTSNFRFSIGTNVFLHFRRFLFRFSFSVFLELTNAWLRSVICWSMDLDRLASRREHHSSEVSDQFIADMKCKCFSLIMAQAAFCSHVSSGRKLRFSLASTSKWFVI